MDPFVADVLKVGLGLVGGLGASLTTQRLTLRWQRKNGNIAVLRQQYEDVIDAAHELVRGLRRANDLVAKMHGLERDRDTSTQKLALIEKHFDDIKAASNDIDDEEVDALNEVLDMLRNESTRIAETSSSLRGVFDDLSKSVEASIQMFRRKTTSIRLLDTDKKRMDLLAAVGMFPPPATCEADLKSAEAAVDAHAEKVYALVAGLVGAFA